MQRHCFIYTHIILLSASAAIPNKRLLRYLEDPSAYLLCVSGWWPTHVRVAVVWTLSLSISSWTAHWSSLLTLTAVIFTPAAALILSGRKIYIYDHLIIRSCIRNTWTLGITSSLLLLQLHRARQGALHSLLRKPSIFHSCQRTCLRLHKSALGSLTHACLCHLALYSVDCFYTSIRRGRTFPCAIWK